MKYIACVLLSTVCFLSSCALVPYRINRSAQAEDDALFNLETICSSIQSKDVETVKNLFSKNALSQVVDYDKQFENLIEFIGDVTSWESDGLHGTYTHSSYGEKTVEVRTEAKITTDKGKFILRVLDYPLDTIEEENQGVYMIYIASVEYDGIKCWRSVKKAGIFIPEVDGIDDIDPELVYGKVEGVEEQVD